MAYIDDHNFIDDEEDPLTELRDFTLEDSYDHLKEIEAELVNQLEELTISAGNNPDQPLPCTVTPNIIRSKEIKFLQSAIKATDGYDTNIKPIIKTTDLYEQTLWELKQAWENARKVSNAEVIEIEKMKSNIAYYESNIKNLEIIKNSCANAIDDDDGINDFDSGETQALYLSVKQQLADVAESIMPDVPRFKNLFSRLTWAYLKGGDDKYIEVEEEMIECAIFLTECELAMYHRNDKNQIRLMDFF